MKLTVEEIRALAQAYAPHGTVGSPVAFGGGHINDTYLLSCGDGSQFVLQRINQNVFPDPHAVMDNIQRVTHHLRKRIRAAGGRPGARDAAHAQKHRGRALHHRFQRRLLARLCVCGRQRNL